MNNIPIRTLIVERLLQQWILNQRFSKEHSDVKISSSNPISRAFCSLYVPLAGLCAQSAHLILQLPEPN